MRENKSNTMAIHKGLNKMALSFFKEVDKLTDCNENIAISPLSLAGVLVMLANGADGNTLKQITKVLGVEGQSMDNICDLYSKLNRCLTSPDKNTAVDIANSIWIDEHFKVKDDYITKNKSHFDAEVYHQILSSNKTLDDINSWCNRKTNGNIKQILEEPLSEYSVLVLINALYFKGKWENEFERYFTRKKKFTNSDGSKSNVKMMNQTDYFDVYVGEEMDYARFPYVNNEFYMEVYLPHKDKNLDECMNGLSEKEFSQMRKQAENRMVDVYMPKIEIKTNAELTKCLKAMGMPDAFSIENANFSGISDDRTYVSCVKQAVSIKINEEGTEAAAITLAEMEIGCCPDFSRPVIFNMNRPFLYLIREKKTGTILFMGKVRKL